MIVGLLIAFQIYIPELNMETPWLTFGRLRPIHTNAVIFAFVGNSIFAGVYYSMQRLLKTPIFSLKLAKFHFWAWQIMIVFAALSLFMGITTSKEYAELEWPFDIAIALIWVIFGINLIGSIVKRRERHLYVAIWFYLATFITVAVLHIVNSIELPVNFLKSYSAYAGVQDALVQWWYGHNAVAFFLTTPILGLMYYFLPKAANRPVFSYRLSIIHFWALIFIYIWAGPHHLLYTALPDWAQSLGTVFSIMLIAPSWGGMLNGLLTLRGAWDRVREDAVLKFMVVAVTAYGMATLEGPLLSLKNLNAIAHYTDWIPAHVHVGTLGWNGFMAFAVFYFLIPKIYNTTMYSRKWMNVHFWLGTLGIIFWVLPMYFAGFTQSLMWKEFAADGSLVYGNFLETVTQIIPMYVLRSIGGTLYVAGLVLMIVNIIKTVKQGTLIATEEAEAPALEKKYKKHAGEHWHRVLERKPTTLMVLATIAILIGGMVEIIPMLTVKTNIPTIEAVKPYTPLELEGRDLYIKEGCNNCHSQMVRPFRSETERYGEYSKAGEYVYDHPHLWGSKRTGPDLHRVGAKYGNLWHYKHMLDPTIMSEGSIMPPYPWMLENDYDKSQTVAKMKTLVKLGVPYSEEEIAAANDVREKQAREIAADLMTYDDVKETFESVDQLKDKEIIALISYLQRLGTDIKTDKK
jgi:cytochrome c oxidase cbb3-type subunit I/II